MTLELTQPNSDFACEETKAQGGEVAASGLSCQWWQNKSQTFRHSESFHPTVILYDIIF